MEQFNDKLWYLDADQAVNNNVSWNSAKALPNQSGYERANLTVFRAMIEVLRSKNFTPVMFDFLNPNEIARATFQDVQSEANLTSPINSRSELRDRIEMLKLFQTQTSDRYRKVASRVRSNLQTASEQLQNSIDETINEAPFAILEIMKQASEFFGSFKRENNRVGLNSRGSEDIVIFVDNKQRVRQAITESGDQLSATELLKQSQESRLSQRKQKAQKARNHQWIVHKRNRGLVWKGRIRNPFRQAPIPRATHAKPAVPSLRR